VRTGVFGVFSVLVVCFSFLFYEFKKEIHWNVGRIDGLLNSAVIISPGEGGRTPRKNDEQLPRTAKDFIE